MSYVVSGTSNVAIGPYALQDTDSGFRNVAVGRSALIYNIIGGDNVGIGDRALRFNNSNYNTGVGRHSLENNIFGEYNSAIGWYAGSDNNNQNGNGKNTFLGALSNTVSGSTVENSTAVGYGAIVTTSNTIQLGDEYIEIVNTSGIVSATAFYGDGSGLTNVGGSSDLDSNGNLIVVDVEPTFNASQTIIF